MRNRQKSLLNLFVLALPAAVLLLHTAAYFLVWYNVYYQPKIRYIIKLYFRGHILIALLYMVLLYFFFHMYGGLNAGYAKVPDLILSQMFSLLITDVFTYFQISLMANWLIQIPPMLLLFLFQLLISVLWVNLCDRLYKRVFPPRRLLLIHGSRPIQDIFRKFASRPDQFKVVDCVNIEAGRESVEKRILSENNRTCEGVVIWDIPTAERNALLKFCYENAVRIYTMPKIPDVLMSGSMQLHLFDTPIYLTREYPLTFAQRFWKRAIDIVCSLILMLLTSPIMAVSAVIIKAYDGGPVLYRQVRCTKDRREFKIIKFRSMKVDAEKNGAQLAKKDDDRITPYGRFIRKVRIDELPQLFNILAGDMSFVGPRPERPEIIEQYVKEMPEFVYRMKVKAGLAGYAPIYGKYNTTPYDKLKLDLTYIQNYSLWLDIKLMLLTLKIVLQPESTEGVDETQTTALRTDEEDTKADEEPGMDD